MAAWLIVIAGSVAAIVFFAGRESPAAVAVTAALAGLAFIVLALRERDALQRSGASASRLGERTARHMGLVWLWGALGLLLTYLFVLVWREWWHFVLAFAAIGALCLGYAVLLGRDADAGRDDETMLTLGRYLSMGQLVGTLVAVAGLSIDPDKEFLWINEGDWAANSIFLFGALALAVITAQALLKDSKPGGKAAA